MENCLDCEYRQTYAEWGPYVVLDCEARFEPVQVARYLWRANMVIQPPEDCPKRQTVKA